MDRDSKIFKFTKMLTTGRRVSGGKLSGRRLAKIKDHLIVLQVEKEKEEKKKEKVI